ncbi:MAG: Ig-like domain-containing protein [Dehalococcoidia bacterium]
MNEHTQSLPRRVLILVVLAALLVGGFGSLGRVGAFAPSFTTLNASTLSVVAGQPVAFSATVSGVGPIPTGTVSFTDNGTLIGTVALSGGVASLNTSTPFFTPGTVHSIVATYSGDANYTGSVSAPVTLTVGGVGGGFVAGITLSSSPNPSAAGQTVTFTATLATVGCGFAGGACGPGFCGIGNPFCVNPGCGIGNPFCGPGFFGGGSVQFFDGNTTIGVAGVVGAVASISTSGLAPGTHQITAVWNGFNAGFTFAPTTSSALVQTVNPGVGGTTGVTGALGVLILSGIGTPPGEGLSAGCNQVTLQSNQNTAISSLAGLVSPGGSTAAVWKFDNTLKHFIAGYFSTPGSPTDFGVTGGGTESYFFCVVQQSTITSG